MQPRTLQSVLTELDSVYAPQIDSIRQRQAAIPGQIQAEEAGLGAQQQTAFGDILNGARRRGTGVAFGGIPLAEQARYTADNYLPALARLRQSGREQAMSLEDSILGINERRMQQGQGIYQYEQQAAEQRRQFDEQQKQARAAAAQQARATLGSQQASLAALNAGGGNTPSYTQKGADFQFRDAGGAPITAAQYAARSGLPLAQVLMTMAQAGDKTAEAAYKTIAGYQVMGDPKYGNYQSLQTVGPGLRRKYAAVLGGDW